MMRCICAKFKSPRARVSSSRNERLQLSQNSCIHAKSFAISALLGGGLGAYLSLRKDGVGEKAGEFGSAVVNKVKEI